jgi:thioredoxin reductase
MILIWCYRARMDMDWDCIVVGGGAAGLSAALVLGRARCRTLVVDAGGQSNLSAEGIGGLLGHDGRPPAELYAMGRAELRTYPAVEVREGTVERGELRDGGFALELAGGGRELTRRVILATGMEYRVPDLPGVAELWGQSAFHCPFCHGWEMRDRALAVLGGGAGGLHRALLLRRWSDDVVLLSDGPAELEPGDLQRLSEAGVEVDERPVTRLVARDGTLAAVEFADGSTRAREGLLVPVTVAQRSDLAAQLGAESAEPGPVVADALVVDGMFRTTAEGVSAAGDASSQMQQVALSIAAGSMAAAGIVQSLMAEDHGMEAPPRPASRAA